MKKKVKLYQELGIVILVVALIALAALVYPLTQRPEITDPTQGSSAPVFSTDASQTVSTEPEATNPLQTQSTQPIQTEATQPTETVAVETQPVQTEPAVTETTQPTQTEATEQVLVIVQWPQSIHRNEEGTVTIQGKPNTTYSIKVYYKSGPSTAKGLEDKTSDADGFVTWTWKVSSRTSYGDFKIVVIGGGETAEVAYSVIE